MKPTRTGRQPDTTLTTGCAKQHPAEVGEFTAEETAIRAEVDPADLDRYVSAGVIEPDADGRYSTGHVRRIRIARSLERSGLPIDGLAVAMRQGLLGLDFADTPTYERFDPLGHETFEQAAERCAVHVDLLLTVRESMGFALAKPTDRIGQDELDVVPLLRFMVDHGCRQPVIERSLRTYGESLRRVAETEADWWNSELLQPLLRRGVIYQELFELTSRLSTELVGYADQAVLALYHGQQANQWMRNILAGMEGVLVRAGLHEQLQRPPAIAFLDLTGYTRLTDERGDEAAADLASQLSRLVQRTSTQHGGKPVKWLGDGVMFHFPGPADAVIASIEMVEGAARSGLPPAHVGVHSGPVLFQAGDYFGRTVNVASRIADYARQGEVLVSREVVDAATDGNTADGSADSPAGVSFTPIGPVELKGVSEPIVLYAARREAARQV